MKNLILTALVAISIPVCAADIKQSVCVVSHDDAVTDSLYQQMGVAFQNSGYITVGRSMRNRSNAFGSGFVYEAASGNKYVVTNRHVVYPSKSAKLQFSPADNNSEYKNCEVVYTDRRYDIALIALPAQAQNLPALKASKKSVRDGQEVFSAGFPGLGGSPLWQLGKGILSNTQVNTADFGDTDSLLLYQHTAQVDRGNSGGPLMVKEGDNYSVIGINTYKASSRESTNFSIKVADLDACIGQYESNHLAAKQNLETCGHDFLRKLYKDKDAAANYISTGMLLQMSEKKLKSLFGLADEDINRMIREGSPEQGLKILVVKELANTYKDSTLLHLVNAQESGRQGNTQLAYKKSTHNFAWELTDEGWQISSTDAISKNEAKGSSVYKQYGVDAPEWRHGFQADAKIPLKEGEYWGGSVSYNFFFLGYGIMGVKAEFLSFGGEHEEYDEWYGQNVSVKDDFLGGLHINVGGQLPIKLGRVVLAPYITGGVCVSNAGFFVTPVGGMRLGFEFKNSTCLFLDANYTYRYQVFDFDGESVNPHSVEAGIGFAW